MSRTDTAMQAAGAWLAIASVLMAIALVLHGPPEHHVGDQMTVIAEEARRWVAVHWIAAAALSFFSVTGLIVLVARSRLTENAWTISAWASFAIGALWTMLTAVAEATAVTDAAISDNSALFAAWWAFSEGMANGFAVLALAVAVIAGNESRTPDGVTPSWASTIAVLVGAASFTGWALWSWLDIAFGAPVWVASSTLMCFWLLWFGCGMMQPAVSLASRKLNISSSA